MCNCFQHLPCYKKIQVWMKLKMNILYHLSEFCYFGSLHGGKVEWTQKSVHVHWCNWPFILYITSYNIVSWGFIEACATCSPINTYYHDIQEHNVLFATFCKFGLCTIYSVMIGHGPLTQKPLNILQKLNLMIIPRWWWQSFTTKILGSLTVH